MFSTLIFSNKTEKDIILHDEFNHMIKKGLKCIYILTREKKDRYENGRINEEFLKVHIANFLLYFY